MWQLKVCQMDKSNCLIPCLNHLSDANCHCWHLVDRELCWYPGSCKVGTIYGFHILIGEVMGVWSSLCFTGSGGLYVLSAGHVWYYHTERGLGKVHTDQKKSNTSHIHVHLLTHCWQHKCFMLPAICLLFLPHQICDIIGWLCLSSITEEMEHWLTKYSMQMIWNLGYLCIDQQKLLFHS